MFSLNFKELDKLIHSGAKEITLASDVVLDPGEESQYPGGIALNVDDLVIDGDDHMIDACSKARIFACMAKNVTVKNLRLENGFSNSSGGAIVSSRASDGFSGDIASGAIFNTGELKISEVAFHQNRSTWGAAIYNRGKLSVKSSEFDENRAEMGGAIYNDGGWFSICKSKFRYNESKFNGGAIYNLHGRQLEIFESNFNDNSTRQHGGAIWDEYGELNIKESWFEKNGAVKNGGAICSWDGDVIIEASRLDGNSSGDFMSSGSGGAVHCEGDGKLDILKSNFNKNSADGSGGAVYAYKTKVTISESEFHRNLSEDYFEEDARNQKDCALAIIGKDNLELNNCTFDNRDVMEEIIEGLVGLF